MYPNILNFADQLKDWTDTASLIQELDIVISVDTSVVHLAGALGKEVLLLNRYDSCWRWFTNRTDSDWYPSLKIFRQKDAGDWSYPVNQIKSYLEERLMILDVMRKC
jgi:ADP-heptose:LPS heptosyltransferase